MPPGKDAYLPTISRLDLQALLDTSRLLIESQDIDFILNNLLLVSMGKLLVHRASILRYYPSERHHRPIKIKGRLILPESFDIPRTLHSHGETLFCNKHPELQPLQQAGISLLIGIRNRKRHIGFLALGPRQANLPFTDEEIEVVESLVFMSGIALSNSELLTELRDTNRKLDYKVQELNSLFELSKAFNATVDRNQIIRLLKFSLLGQLFVRKFFIIQKQQDNINILAQNGLRDQLDYDLLGPLLSSLDKDIVPVDEVLAHRFPFLGEWEMELLLILHGESDKPALMGLGKRANGRSFEPADYSFLISLGNLALMSIQKTHLLEDQIEKERMEEELQIARGIQQNLFPDNTPQVPGIELAAINVPSYQVGGDYYDLIRNPNGQLTMAIADVTGKGVPASLLMANLQSVLHVLQPFDIGLPEATAQINALIYQNTPSDKFISFFWCRLDADRAEIHYINAGHNPPLLIRSGSPPIRLSEGGVLLGAMPTLIPYRQAHLKLEQGDVLVMYTDGITEAMNEQQEEFDESRLIDCVEHYRQLPAREILDKIIARVRDFCNNRISDDLTLIVCKMSGSGGEE